MKTSSIVASCMALAALAACTPTVDDGSSSSSSPSSLSSSSSSLAVRPRAKEGELCGGIAGIQCEPTLFCKYDGAYPDAAGTCVK